jgi:hypothetical protein
MSHANHVQHTAIIPTTLMKARTPEDGVLTPKHVEVILTLYLLTLSSEILTVVG